MEWDGYVKLFEFTYFFLVMSILIALKSFSFATPLSIANFLLAILVFIGLAVGIYFFMKRFVLYKKLDKRTDWFDKFLTLFDGIKFNMKKPKAYLIFPYGLKTVYAIALVFLHDFPSI